MIDGIAGHPFSAETLPPPILTSASNKDKIIKSSQGRYGVKSEIVQEKISRWAGFSEEGEKKEEKKPQLKSEQVAIKTAVPDNQPTLYDAICSMCQKPTKVIFQPEKGRPIYCKSCLKKIKSAEPVSFKEADKIETIPFHNPKKIQPQKLPRKEINLSELKKALEESLEEKEPDLDLKQDMTEKREEDTPNHQKKGVIQPGQTVKF